MYLPNVTTFSLVNNRCAGDLGVASFLKCLRIPSLRDFEFYYLPGIPFNLDEVPSPEILQSGLKEFLTENAENLDSLKLLPYQQISGVHVLELLKFTPDLRRLSFSNGKYFTRWSRQKSGPLTTERLAPFINDTLIEGLIPSPENPNSEILCKHLESFEAVRDLQTGITRETLLRLISARRNPDHWDGSALKRVNVSVSYSVPEGKQYETWPDGAWERIPFTDEEKAMESQLDGFTTYSYSKGDELL